MPNELQTCGRRMSEWGPWEKKENIDFWKTDRWYPTMEAAERYHSECDRRELDRYNRDAIADGRPTQKMEEFRKDCYRGKNNDFWLWSTPIPRTCSFCGGIHPEDAITLAKAGWEVERTDKSYKRYLHPPGYRVFMDQILDGLRDGEGNLPEFADPTPPVKLYLQHFTEDQIIRFNEAARKKQSE